MNLKTYDANKFTVISDKRYKALEAVAAVVDEIQFKSIDKDNMEFSTTCYAIARIRYALRILKETE